MTDTTSPLSINAFRLLLSRQTLPLIQLRSTPILLLMALCYSSELLAISVGDRVSANSNLNVRPSPGSSTLLGTQSGGSQGYVVAGPQVASLQGTSYVWWQVNWDTGVDGWSIEGHSRPN